MDGYVNKSDERTCNMKMKKKKMDHRQGTPPSREILKKKKKKKAKEIHVVQSLYHLQTTKR